MEELQYCFILVWESDLNLRISGLLVDKPRLKSYNASLYLIKMQQIGFPLNTSGINLLPLWIQSINPLNVLNVKF